jgi:hypothetical protein
VWLIQNRIRVKDLDGASELMLPSCGTIVWLVDDDRSREELLAVKGASEEQNVISTSAQPGMHFQIGRYRLATGGVARASACRVEIRLDLRPR